MQSGDKKLKHKDYEKNRRQKLNEELRANEASNELLDFCTTTKPPAFELPLGTREVHSSGEDSREEAAAEAEAEDEDLERGNKRTILRRICEQLEGLTDTASDREFPDIYKSPLDIESLALKNLDCCAVQLVVESGKILLAIGASEPVFGLSAPCLTGRNLWDFVPADRRTENESLVKAFGFTARENSDDDKLTTLVTFKNNETGHFVTVLVEGKFSEDPNDGKIFTCLLQEEPDDHLYEAALTYLSVSLTGAVVGVVPGFEQVLLRSEAEVKAAGLRQLLQSSRGEAADLPFLYYVDQLQSGDVNPETCASIVLEDSFRVLDKENRPQGPDLTLVMKPIARPLNYDRFDLIGINLLLLNPESFKQHASSYKSATDSSDTIHRIMSWTDS